MKFNKQDAAEIGKSVVCAHGSLKRKCEICERDARIAELQAENKRQFHNGNGLAFAVCELQAKLKGRDERIKELEADKDHWIKECQDTHLQLELKIAELLNDKDRRNQLLRKCWNAVKSLSERCDGGMEYIGMNTNPLWQEILPHSNDQERKT